MKREYYFYLLLFVTVAGLFFTYPFTRYPYDIWEHLFTMDSEYINLLHMPESRKSWHHFWTLFFDFFGVENSQILLRAKIIHTIQTLVSFFALFFFSRVMIRILFRSADRLAINYMAYWSTILWFTIFATFSVHYHQMWIMWYSVNYQISLPLFWYSLALILIVLFDKPSPKINSLYLLQIVIITLLILRIHPMEILYLMMHLFVLLLVFGDKVWFSIKKNYYIWIPLFIVIAVTIKAYYQDQLPLIIGYLHIDRLPQLYQLIIHNGELLEKTGNNRAFSSFNELMILTLLMGSVTALILLYHHYRDRSDTIDRQLFIFLILTSLFVLIPIFTFSSGVASVIAKISVVNRFYYSASIFILFPVSIYYLFSLYSKEVNLRYFNATVVVILLGTTLYSRDYTLSQNYYKNIKSLESSFFQERVGFHLTQDHIDRIGTELKTYESRRDHNKTALYLARGDIAMVLRYIYRQNVYWRGRKTNPTYPQMEAYIETRLPTGREGIIFMTPKGFPDYEPYR
ncbi:MAG: hypothetical protein U9R27_09485 [Campylobacterota bacterium]|nr:hypothetical protein [Campylobacterota bacterium]